MADIMQEFEENNKCSKDFGCYEHLKAFLPDAIRREKIRMLENLYNEWIKGNRDKFKMVIRAEIDRLESEIKEQT